MKNTSDFQQQGGEVCVCVWGGYAGLVSQNSKRVVFGILSENMLVQTETNAPRV